ncbi:MAG: hypothetical protein IIA61_05715 [Candidatus Marinimicrobia bacterium]|nr:hypothetical protein [Candidatus Neomarinimicrobiota bacterium]
MSKQHKKYTRLLLKESLKDEDALDMLQISRVETWHVENAADFHPDIWTAIYFEGDENKVDMIADRLSQSIESDGRW